MSIQGSINQLLVLSAAAFKTSSALKEKADEEWGEQKDIDTLYQIKEEAFHIDPSEKRHKELGDLYKATTEGMTEKQISDQAAKEKQEKEEQAEKEKQAKEEQAKKEEEAKHEKFAQDFSEGIGFNPVQKEEPSWRQAALEARKHLNNKQEEKRQSRLNSKGGSL